ncbi:MAG: glycosyltransferase family 39 protein [Patescibacteria group bacterium]|nr:glycosyltransferase family 39 protein [Patescibacteria group bacterium]
MKNLLKVNQKILYFLLFFLTLAFLLINLDNFAGIDYSYWSKQIFGYYKQIKTGQIFPAFFLSHPAATVLHIGSFSIFIQSWFKNVKLDQIYLAIKIPFVLIVSFFIPLIYYLLKKINFSKKVSFLTALLISLNTLIWRSNPADILFGIFSTTSILIFIIYLKEKKNSFLYLSAFLCGLSILSRFSGVLILPVILFLIIVFKHRYDVNYRNIFKKLLIYILIILIIFLIFWPNLWFSGIDPLINKWQGNQNALIIQTNHTNSKAINIINNFCDTIEALPGLELIFSSLFLLFSINFFLKKKRTVQEFLSIILFIIVIFFFTAALFIKPKIWSIRYSIPALIILDIIVSYTIFRGYKWLKQKMSKKIVIIPYILIIIILYIFSNLETFIQFKVFRFLLKIF